MHTLPAQAGISFKPEHFQELIQSADSISWLEIHPENYMVDGGPQLDYLCKIRELYPLSMHGVGMSLGSEGKINKEHLDKLKKLVDRFQPEQISEHLSWSHWKQQYFNDLLPTPYTKESLSLIINNVNQVQDTLKREIIIENPSTYIAYPNDTYSETEFLNKICQSTGCGLLLDINNVFVTSSNHEYSALDYLDNTSPALVKEIHLAGHSVMPLTNNKSIRIDDHGSKVCNEVWQLLRHYCKRHNCSFPTLIEWDTNIPDFITLKQEADKSAEILNHYPHENGRP